MKITDLYRYPVKSMGGEALQSSALDQWGLLGDRVWAVKDRDRASIQVGKKSATLMQCRARFVSEPTAANRSAPISIRFPDQVELKNGDPAIGAKLSTVVGLPAELTPITAEPFRREPPPPGTDMEAYLRAMFARNADEPLPDLSVFPQEVMAYEAPPGTWFDALPILLMTIQGLDALTKARSESRFDVRRFRPNILIDAGGEGFVENQWVGKTMRIGDVQLGIEMACPRCIMTTHGFDDLPKDSKIMRALVQQNGGNAGVYARVIKGGTIRTGDTCIIGS